MTPMAAAVIAILCLLVEIAYELLRLRMVQEGRDRPSLMAAFGIVGSFVGIGICITAVALVQKYL